MEIITNTDAYKIETLDHMKIGVSAAKKGWIKKETVLNTLDVKKILAFRQINKSLNKEDISPCNKRF